MAHKTDAEMVQHTHNTARFFVENRQIAWVLLIGTVLWGWFGYHSMPQRKDPDIPVRVAVALTQWPGMRAEEVEQQVTRPVEEKIAENQTIHPGTSADYGIRSLSMPGLSVVYVQLAESVTDTSKQFSDINLKLNWLNNTLPQGAGPIQFLSGFGDTAALMLTVASPRTDPIEISLRARGLRNKLAEMRAGKTAKSGKNSGSGSASRVAAGYCLPQSVAPELVRQSFAQFALATQRDGVFTDAQYFSESGCIGLDADTALADSDIRGYIDAYVRDRLHASELHPDAWGPLLIRNLDDTEKLMTAAGGDKYSYRELDDFTDLIARTLAGTPQASKYQRAGVVPENV